MNRSLFALGLGCTLAILPLQGVFAQAGTGGASTQPTASVTPIPTDPHAAPAINPGQPTQESNTKVVSGKKGVKDMVSLKDKMFMRQAAGGNEAEIQMALLALKNAESEQVKAFAQKMIDDHGMANKQLEQIAQDKGVQGFRPELSEENRALVEQMSSMRGTAFDTAYIKHAVSDHETDVKEYKAAGKTLKDPDLKSYDTKTLTIIEDHLKMAKELGATKTKAVNS